MIGSGQKLESWFIGVNGFKVLSGEVVVVTCWCVFVHQYGIGLEETRYGCHNKANKILF